MLSTKLHRSDRIERVRECKLSGLTLYETVYPSASRMPRHLHELAHFSYVLSGAYTERYGYRNRSGKPSTLILHPQYEHHAVEFHQTGASIFTVQVESEWLDHIRDYTKVLDSPQDIEGGTPVRLAVKLYQEFRTQDEASPLVMEGFALEILAASSRQLTSASEIKRPRWLEQAREMLREHFSEGLAIKDIAQAVSVHPVHLSRMFRRQYRCTMGEYVRQLRIEFSSHQLSSSDTPLLGIALAAGFSDQSHFSRTFKRYTGMTPAEYRKISRSR